MTQDHPTPESSGFLPTLDGSVSASPALTIDLAEFEAFLEDTGWSDQEKQEYLEMLWSIITEFVALGFGIHPVQRAKEICGQPSPVDASAPGSVPDGVELRDQFECHAGERAAKKHPETV